MSKPVSWVVLPIVAALSVAVAYGAYVVAGDAWDAVVNYQSPYVDAYVEPSTATSPLSRRVVLVIIDGLRLDAASEMSVLDRMGDYASDYVLTVPQPSLSYPNWTTIMSGAPPFVSGVVTNWHEGAAPLDTLIDSARSVDETLVVVGPSDLKQLFPEAALAEGTYFEDWSEEYMAATYVDRTIDLVSARQPRLAILLVPDIDEAGHSYGGQSAQYAQTVARVDRDLRRLVESLQDTNTTFVFVADHGHIDTGGHGGWDDDAVLVRGVFGGAAVNLGVGQGELIDVAPTIALLAGIPVPSRATGTVLEAVSTTSSADAAMRQAEEQRSDLNRMRVDVVLGDRMDPGVRANIMQQAAQDPDRALVLAEEYRLERDRTERLPYGAAVIGAALLVLAAVGMTSWPALASAGLGTLAYYLVYNALFFGLHGYQWSLSAFNSEDLIKQWMNGRMVETVGAGLIGVAVAAYAYPLLRRTPKGPSGRYLAGWLALGPATILVIQATLALQAGWFTWWWGLRPTWRLPDLKWAFKFDLDLVQMTALGAVAVVAPIVTFLVGRYHHKVRAVERTAD